MRQIERFHRWAWVVGLALALLVLGVDSARRLNGIQAATEALVGSRLQPEVDAVRKITC